MKIVLSVIIMKTFWHILLWTFPFWAMYNVNTLTYWTFFDDFFIVEILVVPRDIYTIFVTYRWVLYGTDLLNCIHCLCLWKHRKCEQYWHYQSHNMFFPTLRSYDTIIHIGLNIIGILLIIGEFITLPDSDCAFFIIFIIFIFYHLII